MARYDARMRRAAARSNMPCASRVANAATMFASPITPARHTRCAKYVERDEAEIPWLEKFEATQCRGKRDKEPNGQASMCQSREEECEVKEDRAGADEQAGVVALTREGV